MQATLPARTGRRYAAGYQRRPMPMPADLDTAPPSPLTAEIRDGLDFIEARLMQPVTVGGAAMQAIAETAQPFNDSHWYWTDDNAKALELLALPAVRNAEPALADS